jgi:hypothetical protein
MPLDLRMDLLSLLHPCLTMAPIPLLLLELLMIAAMNQIQLSILTSASSSELVYGSTVPPQPMPHKDKIPLLLNADARNHDSNILTSASFLDLLFLTIISSYGYQCPLWTCPGPFSLVWIFSLWLFFGPEIGFSHHGVTSTYLQFVTKPSQKYTKQTPYGYSFFPTLQKWGESQFSDPKYISPFSLSGHTTFKTLH